MNACFQISLATAFLILVVPAFAHDPSQHKGQEPAGPNCSSMKDTDKGKMDMNDPVMKAVHDKCAAQMKHEELKHEDMRGMPNMVGHNKPTADDEGGK